MSGTSSLVQRTRRLLVISAIAPAFVFGVVTVAMAAAQQDTRNMLISAGAAVVIGAVGVWIRWGTRAKPNLWQSAVSFSGWFSAVVFVMMATGSGIEDELGWSETAFFVAVAVVAIGLALLGWLPARRAARLVLADLSPEVVDSPLVVTFTARGTDAHTLSVTPDALEVTLKADSVRKTTTHSFPLDEVAGVNARTETDDGEHPVPGTDKRIRVPRGEVLVVDLGEGPLVFAAKDVRRARDFVEARARRRATAG